MRSRSEKIDLFTQVTQYHESIGLLRTEFDRLAVFLAENDRKLSYEKFTALFRIHFFDHFRFEESVVFPALLTWKNSSEYRSMIDNYLLAHRRMLETGAEILRLFSDDDGVPEEERVTRVLGLLGSLHDRIMRHADDENRNLVPLVSQNSALRFLTGRNFAMYRRKLAREKH